MNCNHEKNDNNQLIDVDELNNFINSFSKKYSDFKKTSLSCDDNNQLIDVDELNNFINSFSKKYSDFKKTSLSCDDNNQLIDVDELNNFIDTFSKKYSDFKKAGSLCNVFELINIGHDEKINSKILAWLLDCNGTHGQGNIFLKELIEYINSHINSCLSQLDVQFISEYSVFLESYPMGDSSNRIDIQVGNDNFILYIEVKIDSEEHNNQTIRYFNKMKLNPCSHQYLLYLTVKKNLAACNKAINISWSEISSIIESVLKKYPIPNFVKFLISQYSNHIKNF